LRDASKCSYWSRAWGHDYLEARQRWIILGLFGLQDAILGSNHLFLAGLDLEALGSSEMQDVCLVGDSKSCLDGRPTS
jgi:hypothetical protein